jgi:hypothetical protein
MAAWLRLFECLSISDNWTEYHFVLKALSAITKAFLRHFFFKKDPHYYYHHDKKEVAGVWWIEK